MSTDRFRLIPAVYLLLRKNDQILLLQRKNTGYQDGKYSLVAGHVDGGELATQAIIREAKEEAGIDLDASSLHFVHFAHRLDTQNTNFDERIDIFFECDKWDGTVQNIEPEKCADLSWFPINNLPENTIPFIRNVLSATTQGKQYSEYQEEPV